MNHPAVVQTCVHVLLGLNQYDKQHAPDVFNDYTGTDGMSIVANAAHSASAADQSHTPDHLASPGQPDHEQPEAEG